MVNFVAASSYYAGVHGVFKTHTEVTEFHTDGPNSPDSFYILCLRVHWLLCNIKSTTIQIYRPVAGTGSVLMFDLLKPTDVC